MCLHYVWHRPCRAMWHSTSLSGPGFIGRLMGSSPRWSLAWHSLPFLHTRPDDVTLPFLLLRLSGQSQTHRCVHVQLCKLQVPLRSSTGVVVTGSSPHSWGRVCRHNSEDENTLETDTVNFRTVVALERVVACFTYECSYEGKYPERTPSTTHMVPSLVLLLSLSEATFINFASHYFVLVPCCWHLNSGASQSGLNPNHKKSHFTAGS